MLLRSKPVDSVFRFGAVRAEAFAILGGLGLSILLLLTAAPRLLADGMDELRLLKQRRDQLAQESKFSEALALAQELANLSERKFGADDPQTADALYAVEWLYWKNGEDTKAEAMHRQTIFLMEKTRRKEIPETARRFTELAMVYSSKDDFAAKELFFQRALEINERTLGPESPAVAENLYHLGKHYYNALAYAKAETYLEQALQINRQGANAAQVNSGSILHILGLVHQWRGKSALAEKDFLEALAILNESLGPENVETAHCMNSLGHLYRWAGNFAKAEDLHLRALTMMEKLRGPEYFDTTFMLGALGQLYGMTGEYSKADPYFQRALAISERKWGAQHFHTANVLCNWVQLKLSAGQTEQALALTLREQGVRQREFENVLSYAPAEDRLAFKGRVNLDVLGTLGSAKHLAEALLHYKGVVMDSLLEDRILAEASPTPEARELVDQLQHANQKLMQLSLAVPKELDSETRQNRATERQNWTKQIEHVESVLARKTVGLGRARRALAVTVAQVQDRIPEHAALLELLRYERYSGKWQSEECYGAVLLFRSREPRWVPLGAAAAIEKNIRFYQHSVRRDTVEAVLASRLRTLYDQVWSPIAAALPLDVDRVIISPDGELNFVSFATLLTPEKRFLAEEFSISYVASGRDLLPGETQAPSAAGLQVWANPDFGAEVPLAAVASEPLLTSRSATLRELRDFKLTALPGAEQEGKLLQRHALNFGLSQVVLRLGRDATEAELRRVQSPFMLHLATHGFFLPERDSAADLSGGSDGSEVQNSKATIKLNPMHRSGLALAGAQRTLAAWAQGRSPAADNDGIVTAEELGALNLRGTWLVVLSACDTGLGAARAGEGVLGLRRGFLQAGAQNLLMTLWPIDDQKTVRLITDFYAAAHRTSNAPQALAEVQRHWLTTLRMERGVVEACKVAGPFILSFQGGR